MGGHVRSHKRCTYCQRFQQSKVSLKPTSSGMHHRRPFLPNFERDACSSFPRTILRMAKPNCPSSHLDSFHSLPRRPDRHTDTLQRLLSPSQWSTLVAVVHHPAEPSDCSRDLCLFILLTTQAPADRDSTAQGMILATSTQYSHSATVHP